MSLRELAAREAQGAHGRPSAADLVPPSVLALGARMHEALDVDWSMSGGWLVMRQWESRETYRLVYARVVAESVDYQASK